MQTSTNQEKNRDHYEKKYSEFSIKNILFWLNHLEEFLSSATKTETSWFGMYKNDFAQKIRGKTVLELGCGDCTNAAVMAALGAEVYANDIADSSGEIIKALNQNHNFRHPIVFVKGDFINNKLASQSFDYVVGKAFLHHLTVSTEKEFLKETGRLLKADGEARFFEPAVNNRFLDEVRWHIPVPGRPSKLQKTAFKNWKENDPHPDRSFSSRHFEAAGKDLFEEVEIHPIGTLERFHRILPKNKWNGKFRRWALKNEKYIPGSLNRSIARSQLIIYRNPS
ncbi:class I SAM-dependent methyltransferase [Salinimicrobium oceani]|uniref:Class I SAM-dependent methyltransferase n=1 Tax=Salinimicrobium oceani TaxID=2722702 RepID=A0ABX1D4D3_9FLAO|nr:class I SAM-dependent methyltransferase [Salinimicrobium oceani]NJW54043.1 class I SAM-dependent methyltransferase [Salinimicrobium oceani]